MTNPKRFRVWRGISVPRWFIIDNEKDVGIDLLTNTKGYRAFDTFEELLDFVNRPSSSRCYL